MKNKKIFKILILLVLFIPAYLAAYNLWLIASDKLTPDNVIRVVVTGANDTEYEYTDRNDIRLYIQIIDNAKIVAEPLRDLEDEESFIVSFYKGQNRIDYQLYLTQNTDDCLIRDSAGDLHLLRRTDAEKLFATPISDSLHIYNNVPKVHVVYDDGADVTEAYPSSGEWFLKKPSNTYAESNVQNVFRAANNIKAVRGKLLEFQFSAKPDSLNILISNENEILLNDTYEEFLKFIHDSNANLRYVLTAEWHQHEFTDYAGKAEYTFDVEYSVPPIFEISKSESDFAKPGEIVTVTALNMRDSDSLSISADIGYTANFINIRGHHVALLPIGLETMGNDFEIELSGSSVAEDKNYKIYVSKEDYNSINIGAQDPMFNAHKSASALASKANYYETIFNSAGPDKIYWGEDPVFMTPYDGNILLNYGWSVTVNRGALSQNKGINIAAPLGNSIAAVHSGRVVFADTIPDDGTLLVIDHGGGVRSWYGHLDRINVSVGEEVAKGQEVAFSGTSGLFTSIGANLYFAISVHNVFVNPSDIIDNGILPD